MIDSNDNSIEDLLQQSFPGPVADEGFSVQVMQRLPRRARFAGWPVALGALGGMLACCFWLAIMMPSKAASWRLSTQLSSLEMSLVVVTFGISLMGVVWALAEADGSLS